MTESKINLNTKELIKKTTQLQGTSGFEHNIRTFMREEMSPFVDELDYDGLGGVFGVKHSENKEAPKLMVAAHMDEVGFMVSSITKNGLMKVLPLGGWNPYVVSSQRFTLQTKMGNYPVVSSSVPPHLLKNKESKKLSIEDILFDGGFESKDEAEALG